MALIDRDALLDTDADIIEDRADYAVFGYSAEQIKFAPVVDAVPVVRCGECKYCLIDLSDRQYHICMSQTVLRRRVNLNGFCSDGERMGAEGGDEG